MALRGRVCARMRIMPTNPEILYASEEELSFMDYWLDKIEHDNFYRLSRILGVEWTKEDISDVKRSYIDGKLNIPLSVIVNPHVLDAVKKMFLSSPAPGIHIDKGEEVVELGDLSEDDFKKMLSIFDSRVKE